MVRQEYSADEDLTEIFLQPNRSLTWQQTILVFSGMTAFLTIIGLGFALMGYWLVLPFAGLEILVLGACFYRVAMDGRQRQILVVSADKVRVEKGLQRHTPEGRGGPLEQAEFCRAWVRVNMRRSWEGRHPGRLMIGASGEEIEIGEFLTDQEKKALAEDLGAAITGATTGRHDRAG